jgi:hypothetical protein
MSESRTTEEKPGGAAVAEAQPAPSHERQAAVGPFLNMLEAGDVEDGTIELSHWESWVLSRGLAEKGEDCWPRRLAEGVAFRLRTRFHLSRLQDGPSPAPSELEDFRRELVTDAALGLALQEEIQTDIDNLVAVGEFDEAKKLTAFRHKIGQGMGRIKAVIGEKGFERAEAKSGEMTAAAPEQEKIKTALEAEERAERPTQFKRNVSYAPVHHVTVDKANRVRLLLLTLLFCLLAWGVFFVTTQEAEGPPPLPEKMFLRFEGVQSVDVRPPSLFVTVRADTWRDMADEQRRDLIRDVGSIVSKNGYTGAHFRTTAGVAVAEWLEKSGARLIVNRKTKPGEKT